ncbi:MAG: GNAT family N-acetyltransferase [Novosphingobium sp.]
MASIAISAPAETTAPREVASATGTARIRAREWAGWAEPAMLEQWNALARAAVEPNPFLESWYLLPALRAHDPAKLVQILELDDNGALSGMIPIVRSKRYYGKAIPHLASWTHPNCFLGAPLVARGNELQFWRALFAWADREAGHGLFLHLTGIPLGGRLNESLQQVLSEQKRRHGLVHLEERALLQSRETPEAYFSASLSSKKRKELRRQLARLSEQGELRFERDHSAEGLHTWIEQFLELEASGWKGAEGSALLSRPETEQLFRSSLMGAVGHGRLERLTLTLDGKPIAMLANFMAPPGMFSFKTAYDESYSRYSPGVLLQCENLLVLDRDDIDWSDSCASKGHPMIDHIWRERRQIGRYNIAIRGMLRRGLFSRLLKAELKRNPAGIAQ